MNFWISVNVCAYFDETVSTEFFHYENFRKEFDLVSRSALRSQIPDPRAQISDRLAVPLPRGTEDVHPALVLAAGASRTVWLVVRRLRAPATLAAP